MGIPLHVRALTDGPEPVIELTGRLEWTVPVEVREQVAALVKPGCRLTLDLSGLTEVTGGGVRLLLSFFRVVRAGGGTVQVKGVPQETLDLAEAAGFLHLFRRPPPPLPAPERSAPRLSRIDAYPTHFDGPFALRPGFPLPLGATAVARGVNFAVFSRHATACTLVLFDRDRPEPYAEIPFPEAFRVGDVFAMTVFDLDPESLEYGYRMEGPFDPAAGHRFDGSQVLLDPTARAVHGRAAWGVAPDPSGPAAFRGRLLPEDFDWEDDRPLRLPFEDLVVYEMHVRGFTKGPSSGVKYPGTFAGLREKIPYLQDLGVNCVELLPIFEFDETDNPRRNPATGERLYNYWGYNTTAFFAPNSSYAATGPVGLQADELKSLVKELHRAGIEVVLDVVFNHTAEGNEHGPTFSFRGLDNKTYYMLTPGGHYYNFSGCGNTLNCNNPVVRDFVVDCLRYWVTEYHVDGFRFDLASILGRAPDGAPLNNPPLLESLAADPVLGRTKLIAEAWDAGGLYQVGTFPAYGRWAEWNGKFRDCARKFLKGDFAQVGEMAARLVGSPDLYGGRGAVASVNFVTCHDGFTLADLVSYNDKHNEANGENNGDGCNDNYSWNCGAEGPTDDPGIIALRRRQAKNALALLLVSQGVPMLLMGDECGRSQGGNNNAYCQDDGTSWLDWRLVETNADLHRFCRGLIRLRRAHPSLTHPRHPGPGGPDVSWHGVKAWHADWSPGSRALGMLKVCPAGDGLDAVYVVMNMHWGDLDFEPPRPPQGLTWHLAADTAAPPPDDVCEPGAEPPLADPARLSVRGRSVVVLVAR